MKRTVAVLALVLFASCGVAFSADTASIVYIDGDVTMNGAPASVGDDVQPGATIRTAPDAVCQVVFNRKNIVHMAGGTDPDIRSGAALAGARHSRRGPWRWFSGISVRRWQIQES